MDLIKLQKIKKELDRYQDTIDEAIKEATNTVGTYGKHNIGGTRLSGAVKRGWLELKFRINKLL